MPATNARKTIIPTGTEKLELYRLIGEGYKAMQENRTSTPGEDRKSVV